jgi:MatE
MMGWMGTISLAAHQIVVTCAATTFMFPLGISIAAGVPLGHAVGSQAYSALRRIAAGAMMVSVLIAIGFGTMYLTLGHQIAHSFTNEAEVVKLGGRLMIIAGIFQIAASRRQPAESTSPFRPLALSPFPAYVAGHAKAFSPFLGGHCVPGRDGAQSPDTEIR